LHAPNNGGVPGAWAQLGQPQNVFLQPTVLAGLYCDNAGGVGLNTATFTQFSVVPLHKAPIVDAGSPPANPTSPISLAGAVIDDGLPAPFSTLWTAASAPGPVTFGNPSALATSASFTAGGAYTLRLFADDGIARTFDDLTFISSAFLAWQNANFPGGATNPDAAPLADPDRDGLSNLAEYAAGTDPNTATAQLGTLSTITIGADQFLRLTVVRNPLATDVTMTVEANNDLAPAGWSAAGLIIEEDTPTLLQVRDNVPISATPARFLHVRATLP